MRWTVFSPLDLSNRLRVLASVQVLANRAGAEFEMLWPLNEDCNCAYENLFLPDSRVRSVHGEETVHLPQRIGWSASPPDLLAHVGDIVFGHMSWLVRPDLYPAHAALWPLLAPQLDALVPTPEISARVAAFEREHFRRPMIGVHLRRGDFHFARPDVVANTEAALRVIDRRLACTPGAGIFLATDDGAVGGEGQQKREGVREILSQRYGERVVWTTPRSLDRNQPEAIEDALVDLLLLRKTVSIVGTSASSFSELAAFGRGVAIELAGGEFARLHKREQLLRRLGIYPLFMCAARKQLGRAPGDFVEAWQALRYSPWGDKLVTFVRRAAPKLLQ